MGNIKYAFKNRFIRWIIRIAMTAAFSIMKLRWFVIRPLTRGVSAFCFTPEGRIILVYSTYEAGWNLPSGGLEHGEDGLIAIKRELREEIGMTYHDSIEPLCIMDHVTNFKTDREEIFIVTEVSYEFMRNIEIERLGEFSIQNLPDDISAELEQRLALCRSRLSAIADDRRPLHQD